MSLFNTITSAFNTAKNAFTFVKSTLSSLKTQPDRTNIINSALNSRMQEKTSPSMDYMFAVEMPDLYDVPSEVGDFYRNDFNKKYKKTITPDEIHHRVYSLDAPNIAFGAEKMHTGGSHYFIAGHRDYGNITIRLDEYEDGKTQKYFSEWIMMIKGDNVYNIPAIYKKRIIVYRVSTLGIGTLSKMELSGCFPTNVAVSEFNTDGSSISQIVVTFSVDKVRYFEPNSQINFDSATEELKKNVSLQTKSIDFEASQIFNILGRIFG